MTARETPWVNRLVEWGVLAYILLIPFAGLLEPPLTYVPQLLVLVGMVLPRLPRWNRVGRPPPLELIAPFLLFVGAAGLSLAFSSRPELSLERAAFAPSAFLFFFAVQDAIVDRAAFERLCLAVTVTLFLLGIDGLYQYETSRSLFAGKPLYAERVVAGVPHPNDLVMIPLLMPFSILLAVESRTRWAPVFVAVALPLAIATALLSQSRNVWVGFGLGLAMLIVLPRFRMIAGAAAGLAVLLFVAALVLDLGALRTRLATLGALSQEGRIGVWLAALGMFRDHPIVGIGPHLFGEFYLPYLDRASLPAGYRPELARIPWGHNIYLEMLAERGLLGLIGLLALVLAALRRLAQVLSGADREIRTYAVVVAASIAQFLALGIFDLTFLKDWVSLMFFMLTGLAARLPHLAEERQHDAGGL
jgi:O-antigen ligase